MEVCDGGVGGAGRQGQRWAHDRAQVRPFTPTGRFARGWSAVAVATCLTFSQHFHTSLTPSPQFPHISHTPHALLPHTSHTHMQA